jgi:hypothetical protein
VTVDGDTRARAVRVYHHAWSVTRELAELADAGSFGALRLAVHGEIWLHRLGVAGDVYEGTLSGVAVSRCPYTGEVVGLALDVVGLDGPWWNLDAPRRPPPTMLPATFVGYDGAVRLDPPAPPAPFPRRPGPEVPTVIPRLLDLEDVTAVCSSLWVGANQAWLVAYFARPGTPMPPPPNDWGADQYLGVLPDGSGLPWPVDAGPEVRDPDLGAWVERERLCWIAPGDADLEVRRGLEGCPYVGVEGDAELVWLVDSEPWRASSSVPTGG